MSIRIPFKYREIFAEISLISQLILSSLMSFSFLLFLSISEFESAQYMVFD